MKKETRTRVIEEKYDVFIAEDGISFNTESECKEYERNTMMQPVSKLHINKLDGWIPLTDGMTSDGNEFYWYKVKNKEEFDILNMYYEGNVDEPKTYPEILCLEITEYYVSGRREWDVYTYKFSHIQKSIVDFMKEFGYKVKFEKE